jgi:peptidoglycan/xylan/chitin deacetylase (PgdA/CDA1 family)
MRKHMTAWLDSIRATLERRASPIAMFIRDDDAGWNNERLYRLLDVTRRHGVPVDLAVIPDAVDAALARALRQFTRSDDLVAIHQHGRRHVNHETVGRKSEFGASRSVAEQRDDIHAGQRRLRDLMEGVVDPIFTPPWNRCTAVTAACLAALGFEMLSRDADAEMFGFDGIRELPVHLDWTGRRGVAAGLDEWGDAIAARLRAADAPVGLMLHHAAMTHEDRQLLDELLRLLAGHAAVKFSSMAALGGCTSARGVV